jgi:hypothetical protein
LVRQGIDQWRGWIFIGEETPDLGGKKFRALRLGKDDIDDLIAAPVRFYPGKSYQKDLVIFFPEPGRPNVVLNRRLPGTTARNILPIVALGDKLPNGATGLTRVETFPGAACLTRFAVMHAPRQIC